MTVRFANCGGVLSGQLYSTRAQLTRSFFVLFRTACIWASDPETSPSSSPKTIMNSPLAAETANSQLSLMDRMEGGRQYLTLSSCKYSRINSTPDRLSGSELSETISSKEPKS